MLQRSTFGQGRIDVEDEHVRLRISPSPKDVYSAARLDDYGHLEPRPQALPYRPPARLRLYARTSHPAPGGTLGFGFAHQSLSAHPSEAFGLSRLWFFWTPGPERAWKGGSALPTQQILLADVALAEWHQYEIEWQPALAVFRVDGVERWRTEAVPVESLGITIWIDNRAAFVEGGASESTLCEITEEQWLEVKSLKIDRAL